MALTECYFAVLGRSDYEKVLKKIEQKEIQHKIDFFIGLPFLSHWTRNQIQKHKLHYSF